MSFLEQAVKMAEFCFHLTPKPYKNSIFFQTCFRFLKAKEDMTFDNVELDLSPDHSLKEGMVKKSPTFCVLRNYHKG